MGLQNHNLFRQNSLSLCSYILWLACPFLGEKNLISDKFCWIPDGQSPHLLIHQCTSSHPRMAMTIQTKGPFSSVSCFQKQPQVRVKRREHEQRNQIQYFPRITPEPFNYIPLKNSWDWCDLSIYLAQWTFSFKHLSNYPLNLYTLLHPQHAKARLPWAKNYELYRSDTVLCTASAQYSHFLIKTQPK